MYVWSQPIYSVVIMLSNAVNSLRPRQSRRHFADDIFKCISLIETVWIPIQMSLKYVPRGPINNIPALVQIMDWHRPGDKPLSEPMMDSLPTHICVTRPQWVNWVCSCSQTINIFWRFNMNWLLYFNNIFPKNVIKINTLNMKICWVFININILIIFK